MIGVFTPITAPYSREELASRRKELEPIREEAQKHPEQRKTTAEVLAHLKQLGEGQP